MLEREGGREKMPIDKNYLIELVIYRTNGVERGGMPLSRKVCLFGGMDTSQRESNSNVQARYVQFSFTIFMNQ
jgi:hypothetical protein